MMRTSGRCWGELQEGGREVEETMLLRNLRKGDGGGLLIPRQGGSMAQIYCDIFFSVLGPVIGNV